MNKKVILLNGPSSSGKSTLAGHLQAYIEKVEKAKYDIVSIDDFLKMSTSKNIYEDDVFEISKILCEKVLDQMQTHAGVIVDHVITSERIYEQLTGMLSEYDLKQIHVTCPLEVLMQRERERGDRCIGGAEASYMYLVPKEGYHVTVDTHNMTHKECCERIFQVLNYE